MIRFYYDQAPSEGGPGLVEFTDRVNLADENVSLMVSAEQGAVASSSFVVDDPDGDWHTVGHRRVWVIEDSAPAENQLVYWGYLSTRPIARRDGERTEAARKWSVNLTDINTVLSRKVMAGNDTDRPEDETDWERIDWLSGTGEAGNIADWTTYVPNASAVNMSDSNYNGQMLANIVDDCSQQALKNYYLRWRWDDDAADYIIALWYARDTVDLAISDLRISNVEDDVDDSTTWAASLDSEWTPDPSRVFSGMFGNYDGGYTYQTNFDTLDEFANRDTITSWPNIKKLSKAQARAQAQLSLLTTEEETITTYIMVPPENVNDAMAGDQIQVKFSHFPGFEDFRSVRILDRTVTFVTPEFYRINFTLTPNAIVPPPASVLIAIINNGGPSQGDNPPGDLSTNTWTQVFWTGNYKSNTQFPGPGGPGGMGIWVRNVVPGEGATVIETSGGASLTQNIWVYQVEGVTLTGLDEDHGIDTVPYSFGGNPTIDSPTASVNSIWFAAWMLQKVTYGQITSLTGHQGTTLGDVTGLNVATTGLCGVNDHAPPTAHIGYAEGTGTLTIGADFVCDGAGPGDYNHYGRGWGGVLLETVGTFAIVQQGFQAVTNANCTVTLPALP